MYYQMTKIIAIKRSLTHVINDWYSSKCLWNKQNHMSKSIFLHDQWAINMI